MSELSQKVRLRAILFASILGLPSCATQTQKIEKTPATPQPSPHPEAAPLLSSKAPPRIKSKHGKELKLVRVMEGGACNSKDQGAKGLFLVYAEPNDIERIKKEKGSEVFGQFESDIEKFSLQAFQESVAVTNIAENPFALDIDDAQQQVAKQLKSNFKGFAAPAIENFESNTDLTIDVVPFSPSMVLLLEKCNAALNEAPQSI